jgi:ankyrin repeat protein
MSSDYNRFRWVDLQLDSLKKCLTYSDVKKALTSLPKTLCESYERILLAIDEIHRQKALIALQWISHCCQPITIEELAEAVIIDPSGTQPFDPRDRLPNPSWLLEILSGLVVVTKTNRRLDWDYMDFVERKYIMAVEIAHFSVKEYLNSAEVPSGLVGAISIMKQSPIEAIIQGSLLYLNYYSMSDRKSASRHDLEEFPLLLYASHFWHEHVLAAEEAISLEIKDLVYEFLTSEMPLLSWLKVYHVDDPSEPFPTKDREFAPPLYYLAFWGADHLVKEIVNAGADVNAEGGTYHTALQAAAYSGETNILKLLLENGADVNMMGGEYGTALQAASWSGYKKIVKLLLAAGADVNAQGGEYCTALHAAASGNDVEMVAILIAAGADVHANVEPHGTALNAAFVCDADEHTDVIELLLAAGADISDLDDEDIRMIRVMEEVRH